MIAVIYDTLVYSYKKEKCCIYPSIRFFTTSIAKKLMRLKTELSPDLQF